MNRNNCPNKFLNKTERKDIWHLQLLLNMVKKLLLIKSWLISAQDGADIKLDLGFDFLLTIQFDPRANKCSVLNQFNNSRFLFKGKPIPAKLDVDRVCKIMVDGSDEFISIRVIGETVNRVITQENISESDIKAIYGNDVNAAAKLMIEKRKGEIEQARVAIIKDIGASINSIKSKFSMNSKSGIFLHIALFFASLICAFGVSNYLTGLPLSEAGNVIQMPANMKLIFIYALIVYGIGLILKQGIFLYFLYPAWLPTGNCTCTSSFHRMNQVSSVRCKSACRNSHNRF